MIVQYSDHCDWKGSLHEKVSSISQVIQKRKNMFFISLSYLMQIKA